MSITQMCNSSEDEDGGQTQQQQQQLGHHGLEEVEQPDPEVRLAAEALDSLAHCKWYYTLHLIPS
jgi:hypothetical protein